MPEARAWRPCARSWKSARRLYHRGRQEYGGAKEETLKRLKALEKENTQLKKLVANPALDLSILKEVAEGAERSGTAKGRSLCPQGQRRRALATW